VKEKLNCSTCNAIVEITMLKCDYCGNNFRVNGKSAALLKLKDVLEEMLINSEPKEVISFINSSVYKEHPIIKFRLSKAEILICLFDSQNIDSQKFCDIINRISQDTFDYKAEFINYISLLLPSLHISLYPEDYENILAFLRNTTLDYDSNLSNKLTEQVLISDLGIKFMKEYIYYTDDINFVNDKSFINKRSFIINKYEKALKKMK